MTERKKSRTPVRPIPAAVPPPPEPRKSKKIDAVGEPSELPHEPTAPTPATGSPENAAFEAARIVSEIIDIETPTGAVIAAAAAAGAAIEVKRSNERHDGSTADPGEPVPTVRLSRDRILAAIAEDSAAAAAAPPSHPPTRRATEPPATTRVATEPPLASTTSDVPAPPPSPTEPGEPEEPADEEFDPVQIAAAAINRLRKRAQTDLAELRGHYNRHDGLVIVLAMVIIMVVGRIHAQMVQPPTVTFAKRGLTFEHSQAWLAPEPIAFAPSRLLRDPGVPTRSKDPEKDAYHVEFTSTIDPAARIEVLIDKKPAWSNIVSGLDLDRRTRWGELYKMDASSVVDVEGHDWLRTEYTFAHAPQKGDTPRVDRAVEYATKDKDQLYVLTLFGSQREVARIEEVVAPSLRVATNVGLQIEAQTMRLSRQNYPKPVGRAFESTVMIVVADLVDGRLRVKGGGSGIIVGGDGSILTAYHVIHDKDGRLHDVFVIGRFAEADKPPTLMCAGRPSRSKLQRDVDLALVKCDMDLDGRAWLPTSAAGVWQTLPEARKADINMGQRLWVLGYPDAGGGGLTLSQGEVEGFTGVDGAQGRDYIKTDASIRSGNSGGPVVDDKGQLVGIAAAFRTRVNVSSVTETTQVGLVRPLSTASDLLAIAAAGWTPREGHTDVELAPVAVEAPAEGVHLSTKIVDAANEAPIAEALVMVLRKGVSSEDVDVNRLDDQVLSWGRSNSLGEVLLKQPVPVPGTYSVLVIARGYEPLIGKEALTLDADTAASFDPWGKIWLRSR